MSTWSSNYANDPNIDFEVVLEILCDDLDVAVIRPNMDAQGVSALELKIYSHDKDLVIPFEWLYEVLTKAKNNIKKHEELADS